MLFVKLVKMMNHAELCDVELAWYSPSATRQIYCYGWKQRPEFYCFTSTSTWLIFEVLTTRAKFLEPSSYCSVITCTFIVRTMIVYWLFLYHHGPVRTHKAYVPELDYVTHSSVRFSNYTRNEVTHMTVYKTHRNFSRANQEKNKQTTKY